MTNLTETEAKQPEVVKFHTKIKFKHSDKANCFIAFVHRAKSGELRGVRQEDACDKRICILDKGLYNKVLPNVLYQATLIPMKGKMGYIVVDAKIVEFPAKVEVTYVPKAIYRVEVKFGNKNIVFDPFDGIKTTRSTVIGCRDILERRCDIANREEVLAEFDAAVAEIIKRYKADGFHGNI